MLCYKAIKKVRRHKAHTGTTSGPVPSTTGISDPFEVPRDPIGGRDPHVGNMYFNVNHIFV